MADNTKIGMIAVPGVRRQHAQHAFLECYINPLPTVAGMCGALIPPPVKELAGCEHSRGRQGVNMCKPTLICCVCIY